LLEAQLIKRFRPPYNVLLRDDKSFPFILLREDHAFSPHPEASRRRLRSKGDITAPSASAGSVGPHVERAARKLFLLQELHRQFPSNNRDRPCLPLSDPPLPPLHASAASDRSGL